MPCRCQVTRAPGARGAESLRVVRGGSWAGGTGWLAQAPQAPQAVPAGPSLAASSQ